MNYSFLSRIKILSFFILLFASALVLKLFWVQVIHKSSYSDRADRQYVTPSSDIFERGTIYFTRKDGTQVSGAVQASGFKLAITPKDISNSNEVFKQLLSIIPIDANSFLTSSLKLKDPYEEISDHLTKEQADMITSLKLSGVNIYKEKWRFYPGGDMASHALGFVGYQGDQLAGRYGLERQYNNVLSRGIDNPYVNFFAEVFSNVRDSLFHNDEHAGDILTTIEPSVENFLSNKLKEVQDKYNADSIGGIIMNPKDGSIYAMDAEPSFNPNDFSKVKNMKIFSNPIVENVFEFGSVVKPLVMAAGLDLGVVTSDTKYNDKGFVIVDKKQINNFDKKGRGLNTTMQDVLNQSLNTGMVYVFQHLGRDNFRNYMNSYAIGEKTGIDLPNETSGLISNLKSPRDIEYANASFGQGIALTPIEMIRALAALGNGGNLVTPHFVKEIKYNDGSTKELIYSTQRVKFSEKTAQEITRMLVTVMDKSFQGGKAKFDHYSVALKTGTAQVAREDGKGYYEDRHTHSFFGYFPAYNPKFIVFLYAVNPKGVPYASQTWGDPFLEITKFLLNYYEVTPDR
ncbi:MAG: penicillin-binding protein 2 [Candidatus Nomurabacteria bacterium]|nr:penicillin-binding protein 2 [Candidatus Nomurabacteria bacterium]